VFARVLQTLSKAWMKAAIGLLAVFLLMPTDVRTAGELCLQYAVALVAAAGAWLFCQRFARANYLAYAVVLSALSLRGPLGELFGNSIGAMHVQGWIVVTVLAATVLWAVAPGMRARSVQT
jgi:hypothetical protein